MDKVTYLKQMTRVTAKYGEAAKRFYDQETLDLIYQEFKWVENYTFETAVRNILLRNRTYPTMGDFESSIGDERERQERMVKRQDLPQLQELASRTELSTDARVVVDKFLFAVKAGIHKPGFRDYCDGLATELEAQLKKEAKAP